MSYLFALLACSFCSITAIAKGIIPFPLAQMLHASNELGGGGGVLWATKKGTVISAGGTQNMGAQKAGCRHIRREPDTRQLLVNNHAFFSKFHFL
jgi:hypothetical protein